MNFAGIRRHTKLRRAGFIREARRIADERRAVDATELQRFVGLDAMALGAAFHFRRRLNVVSVEPTSESGY